MGYGWSISYQKFKYVGFSLSNLRPKTLDPLNYTPGNSEWGQVLLTPSPFGNSMGIYEWVASSAESAEYMSCHSCIYRLKCGPIRKFPGNFPMGEGHLTFSPFGNSLGISEWGFRKKIELFFEPSDPAPPLGNSLGISEWGFRKKV